MKVLFRVDAGGEIGLGHFYRSITLATMLKEKGHQVLFSYIYSDFWAQQIEQGFPFENYGLNSQTAEITTQVLIRKNRIDLYYVDGFMNFSESFIYEIKQTTKVAFYQNVGSSRHLADIYILPSIHQNRDFFEAYPKRTKIFQGLEYFTFHPQIADIKRKSTINRNLNSIAFAAGGSDPKDTLRKIFSLLDISPDINYFFYFGSSYLFRNSWDRNLASNIHFRQFSHRLILEHDILVNAFGVSTYEFLYLGMPILSYGHQKSTAIASQILAQKSHAFMHIGEINEIDKAKMVQSIRIMEDKIVRKIYSDIALDLLDLKGVNRIIEILEEEV